MKDGELVRRKVMGDKFVDASLCNDDQLNADLQSYLTDHAWGGTWLRSGIDLKTRSIVTVSFLIAIKAHKELKGHLRGAINNGWTFTELSEVLLHSATYVGAPAAQEAIRTAREVFEELGMIETSRVGN